VTGIRTRWRAGLVRRLRHLTGDARGQATTEYVALAGVLVVTALLLSGILSNGVRTFVRLVIFNVRTIAP